ncbi:ABC transporter substrate-binding protein [Pseudoduganella ginsengisoli]|uniref:ABC transporter substrate-binding protein n=1 Tax=Pseudoduganella ginsengisoli TaxID=1462440 RepID=A0A6L6Q5A4_9BURK|nr:ABC transporter substrate-binding protein [Pseudoduganella ginsengisoli]MTW04696.1 ABC transporter substrate-binding protein [Pseudoduganella ginsengisoli]
MNFKRRTLLAAAAAAPFVQAAPSPDKPYRIYMILYRGETDVERGFRNYFATRNIPVELITRDVAQNIARVPDLVAEARALKVDLIYTWGTPVTLAVVGRHDDAVKPVKDIPVVFTMVSSPVGAGFVKSLASSGRNLTGASHVVPIEQQLTAIRTYRRFDRIAAIYNPAEANSLPNMKALRKAAAQENLQLVERPVPLDAGGQPLAASLPQLVKQLAADGVQLLYIGPDSFLAANRKALTEAALAYRLPTYSAAEVMLRDGKALFGLVSGYEAVGRLTAYKAAQILVERRAPSSIPIETLARFSYIVNMSVAAELELYPPLKVINFAELLK